MLEATSLDPKELVLVVIAVVGLLPILLLRTSRSKLFTGGYLLLCLGVLATNVESLALGGLFNAVEHGSIAAAGGVFFAAAYLRRQRTLAEGE